MEFEEIKQHLNKEHVQKLEALRLDHENERNCLVSIDGFLGIVDVVHLICEICLIFSSH